MYTVSVYLYSKVLKEKGRESKDLEMVLFSHLNAPLFISSVCNADSFVL